MARDPRKKALKCKPRVVYGLHPVQEYLRAQPDAIAELYVIPSPKTARLVEEARRAGIPVCYESRSALDTHTQGGTHQGIAVRVRQFSHLSLGDLLKKGADCLLVLDEILDPRNLGALLRTAESAGVGGVILSKRRSAPLSPLVEKAAAGAIVHLSICRVGNLRQTLAILKQTEYWLVGLSPQAQRSIYDVEMHGKIAFVVGGEGKGLRPIVQEACDYLVSIPMRGKVASLNVSVAGAVVLYEHLRRKREVV